MTPQKTPALRIIPADDRGDARGSSFTLPQSCLQFLAAVRDVHVADIVPGAVRGNHYHQQRREVLCIRHTDAWSLHWDNGPGTEVRRQNFTGSGLVLVEIEPEVSHAVRNDGSAVLHLVGFSDLPFDPQHPDAKARPLV